MRKGKFAILLSIGLLVVTVLVVTITRLQERKTAGDEGFEQKFSSKDAKMYLEKIHFVEDKKGRKTWELEAKSIEQQASENSMVLQDVKVTVYSDDGRSFALTGNRGKIFLDTKNMELSGDVNLVSSDGYRLRTSSVAYYHLEKKVQSRAPVEITGQQIHVSGKGLEVDIEAKTFKILGRVKTQWSWGER